MSEFASPSPLDDLLRVERKAARRDTFLRREPVPSFLKAAMASVLGPIGLEPEIGAPEVLDRAAGIGRPGVVAQFFRPGLGTRFALGLEVPLAHALVDRLLGFHRFDGQDRLQVTPVEWGLLTFLAARVLERIARTSPPAASPDLILDRVGPEAFRGDGLGPIVTLIYPVKLGTVRGAARLWLEGSMFDHFTETPSPPAASARDFAEVLHVLTSDWTARAGMVSLRFGPAKLRAGAVLPIVGSGLRGSPRSPTGRVELEVRARGELYRLAAEPVAGSGGGFLAVIPPIRRLSSPREPLPMSPTADPNTPRTGDATPLDVPVTLAVELGRVSLSLAALADLKPGDVLELGRLPTEPVELTSGGRLVARGELVQIDTELGVRVTNVFL